MVPGMLDLANAPETAPTAEGQKVVAALEAWDFTCPTGLDGTDSENSPLTTDSDELLAASGCMAFHALFEELRLRVERNEHAPEDRNRPSIAFYYSVIDPSQLVAGDVYWDDPRTPEEETKHQVMFEALDTVANLLIAELGTDETQWAWGRLHGLRLRSDLATFGIFNFDNPAPGDPLFANDGGLFTVDLADHGRGDFVQKIGPSMRLVCEESPEGPSCTIQLPGGQSSDVDSPNYQDLLFKWLRNEPIELVFDIDQAKANAVRTVTFE
jgi:penicillin amidase